MLKGFRNLATVKGERKSTSGNVLSDDDALLHVDAHDEGGISCNNEEILSQQQKAITEWIKSMGKRLLMGDMNLINTPFPVTMFEPRSYLEKLADVWVYPKYLSAAAASVDPLERMKLVITWFIAGLHHSFEKWKKPFNPILGETWQANLSDGSMIFMEQISHHPPVSAFHIEGPGSKYRFMGLSQPNVSLMLKYYGFKTVAKGFRYVEFADGTRIDISYPAYCMKGVVYSRRPRAEVEGTACLVDTKNRLKAVLRFGAVKGGTGVLRRSDGVTGEICDTSSVSAPRDSRSKPDAIQPEPSQGAGCSDDSDSELYESASETDWDLREELEGDDPLGLPSSGSPPTGSSPPSHSGALSKPPVVPNSGGGGGSGSGGSMLSRIGLSALLVGNPSSSDKVDEPAGVVMSRIQGSWLSNLDFDGKRYWTLKHEEPDTWQPGSCPLPSDSRFRKDLVVLKTGNISESQVWKEQLEQMQRNDKKIRGGH